MGNEIYGVPVELFNKRKASVERTFVQYGCWIRSHQLWASGKNLSCTHHQRKHQHFHSRKWKFSMHQFHQRSHLVESKWCDWGTACIPAKPDKTMVIEQSVHLANNGMLRRRSNSVHRTKPRFNPGHPKWQSTSMAERHVQSKLTSIVIGHRKEEWQQLCSFPPDERRDPEYTAKTLI